METEVFPRPDLSDSLKTEFRSADFRDQRLAERLRKIGSVGRGQRDTSSTPRAVGKRQTYQAGIEKDISPYSMRATGITSFLENGGKLEVAQQIAVHSDSRTTKLYDRREKRIEHGEIERVRFD